MKSAIGIDVGGTFIKGGRVGREGIIGATVQVPTGAEHGPEAVIKNIIEVIRSLGMNEEQTGVGIGMPGLVSLDHDTVKYPPNFSGWTVVPLAARIRAAIGFPCIVDNDANCAAIGEAAFGAGREIPDFIFATLGTGVGGGIIINGEVYRGETGAAGEIGHTTIDYRGPQCNCGSFGCVETYVGNRYFCARVEAALATRTDSMLHAMLKEDTGGMSPELVARAAAAGDAFSAQQLYDAGYALGVGLANAMALLDIHTVIVGGGVAQAGELLFAGTRRAITQFSQKPMAEAFRLLPATLGNTAGILGAARLTMGIKR